MRWLLWGLLALAVFVAGVILANGSWWVSAPANAELRLIAHRGVHQTFSRDGLDSETCTASRINPPKHDYIENSLPSMRAAFAAGADIVELDVHPTTDGRFAVLHDWTLDCRTEGTGPTRDHDSATLKTLDIGYGYTGDGGATYPLRGKGIDQMPMLDEVLAAFPERRFLVNFKSNEAREGAMLADLLAAHPDWREAVWGVYGGDPPSFAAAAAIDGLAVWSRRALVDCLLQYVLTGWTGIVPTPCRDTFVMVPINAAPFLWGWPNLFVERLRQAGSSVILLGPYAPGDPGTAGIDTPELFAQVPAGFDGYVWTNRIEDIGPLARSATRAAAVPAGR